MSTTVFDVSNNLISYTLNTSTPGNIILTGMTYNYSSGANTVATLPNNVTEIAENFANGNNTPNVNNITQLIIGENIVRFRKSICKNWTSLTHLRLNIKTQPVVDTVNIYDQNNEIIGRYSMSFQNSPLNTITMYYIDNIAIITNNLLYTLKYGIVTLNIIDILITFADASTNQLYYFPLTETSNSNFSSVTTLNILSSRNIIANAFFDYNSLTHVSMPSVTSIGIYAFDSCSALTSVSMPSITSIGNGAFDSCSALTSVSMPSITSIGNGAFLNCPINIQSLQQLYYQGFLDVKTNITYGFSSATQSQIQPYSITDNTITSILPQPVSGSYYINIPNSITAIATIAAFGATCITALTIPSSVTTIGVSAFSGCTNLVTLILPSPPPVILGSNAFYQTTVLPSFLQTMRNQSYSYNNLVNAGFTNVPVNTVFPPLSELLGAGYNASVLLIAGYSATDLLIAGYSATDLRVAGYPVTDLRTAMYPDLQILAAGYSATQLRAAGYPIADLRTALYTDLQILAAGYSAIQLHAADYSADQLRTAGYPASDLLIAGYPIADLRIASYPASDIRAAGYPIADLRAALYTDLQILAAGYSATDLLIDGYSIAVLRDNNYPASDIRAAGYPIADLRAALYSDSQILAAGYPATDLLIDGYSIAVLRDNNYPATDIRAAGYPIDDLRTALYSDSQILAAGYSATQLRLAEYSAIDLRTANYTLFAIYGGGYNLNELKTAGYTAIELLPYFSPTVLIDAGFEGVTCFNENSKILCLVNGQEKEVLIQNIRSGVLVKTFSSGYKPVCMIGTSVIYNPGTDERFKDRLFICKKEKYPELNEDLIITGCHSILVDEITAVQREQIIKHMGAIYETENNYRLNAVSDERAEPYNCSGKFNIYHIALENNNYIANYGVYANGLLVESCSKRYLKELSKMRLL